MKFKDIFKRRTSLLPVPYEAKASETTKAIIVSLLSKNPVWTPDKFELLTEAGYMSCMTVFQCVNILTKGSAGIPWQLTRKGRGSNTKKIILDSHPLLDLWEGPNPKQGGSAFREEILAYYLIAGNSYVEKVGPGEINQPLTRPPIELYRMRPDRVKVIPGNFENLVGGYSYSVTSDNPLFFDPTRVTHLKTFHPLNDWYGLSPLKVASMGIDISNMAMTWNMKLLENDMRPPGALKFDVNIGQPQRDIMEEKIREMKSGYDNAGAFMILEGGGEWIPFAITPKDADWLNSEKLTVRRICGVLGVPPELAGDSENKTYSNVKEARRGLYTEGILPLMDYFRDEMNRNLTPLFGDDLRLEYVKDDIEALQEEMDSVFTRMGSAWWTTVDEKRTACRLPEIGGSLGKSIFLPINLVPIDNAGGGRGGKDEKSLKTPSFWQRPEAKARLWNHFIKRLEMKEKTLFEPFKKYFKEQSVRVEKALKRQSSLSGIRASSLLDVKEEAKEFVKMMTPLYAEIFRTAGASGLETTRGKLLDLNVETKQYSEFEITPAMRKKLEKMVLFSGTQINKTTLMRIERYVEKALLEAMTVEDLTQLIIEDKYASFTNNWSRVIARTEAAKVENFGTVEGYKANPVIELKGWLAAFVPDTREEHAAADAKYSNDPIPLDDLFEVGDDLMEYPGDPNASAGNVVNCLCTTYPEVK